MAYIKKNKIDTRVLDGATTPDEIRNKLINYIKTYNQIRDLEDKNLENKTALKYAESRGDFFQTIVDRLQKDDLGGYMYQDVKGYDLEELVHIATELENKQMVDANHIGKRRLGSTLQVHGRLLRRLNTLKSRKN